MVRNEAFVKLANSPLNLALESTFPKIFYLKKSFKKNYGALLLPAENIPWPVLQLCGFGGLQDPIKRLGQIVAPRVPPGCTDTS